MEVLSERDEGFTTRLAGIAPDLRLFLTRYVDNDIQKAMSVLSDQMLANPDLVGVFGDNNHTGDGVALAIRDANTVETIFKHVGDVHSRSVANQPTLVGGGAERCLNNHLSWRPWEHIAGSVHARQKVYPGGWKCARIHVANIRY